jgi:hypothetical protein
MARACEEVRAAGVVISRANKAAETELVHPRPKELDLSPEMSGFTCCVDSEAQVGRDFSENATASRLICSDGSSSPTPGTLPQYLSLSSDDVWKS